MRSNSSGWLLMLVRGQSRVITMQSSSPRHSFYHLRLLLTVCFLLPLSCRSVPASPICDLQASKTPIERVPSSPAGGVPTDAFQIGGDSCHQHFFDKASLRACMADEWIILFGGSNCVSTSAAALDYGGFVMVWDSIVNADGSTQWMGSTPPDNWETIPELYGDVPGLDPNRKHYLLDLLRSAPKPNPGAVRVTWIYTRWFPSVEIISRTAWQVVKEKAPLARPPKIHVNIGVWYSVALGDGREGCDEWRAVYARDSGDYLKSFRRTYKKMMDDFRTNSPQMQVSIRNQAYYDGNMLPIFLDEFEAQPKPHKLTLINWDFDSADWSYIFDYPNAGNHCAHEGSHIILQQQFSTICPIPKTPISKSTVIFPSQPPCIAPQLDYYFGTTKPGCTWEVEQVLGDNAAPACRAGTIGTSEWDPYQVLWKKECTVVPCPEGATGAPSCQCSAVGGRLTWDRAHGRWAGSCDTVPCPEHSSYPIGREGLACECDAGYTGLIQSCGPDGWGGSCVLEAGNNPSPTPSSSVPCPNHSSKERTGICECTKGYTGTISWSESKNMYEGKCTLSECPTIPGLKDEKLSPDSPDCSCAQGYSSSLSWNYDSSKWEGHCGPVFCPRFSSTVFPENGVCTCGAGFVGTLKWEASPSSYSGFCDAASCPTAAKWRPESAICECKSGYTGELTWENGKWAGTCSLVPCPSGSKYALERCTCDELHEDTTKFDSATNKWSGGCVEKLLFAPPSTFVGTVNPATTPSHLTLAALSALFLLYGAYVKYDLQKKLIEVGVRLSKMECKLTLPSTQQKPKEGPLFFSGEEAKLAVSPSPNPSSAQASRMGDVSLSAIVAQEAPVTVHLGVSEGHVPKGNIVLPIGLALEQKAAPKELLGALGPARFCASVHVVAGHLANRFPSATYSWPISTWGFTWVPWFMMLSAYILTFSKLTSKSPDKMEPNMDFFFKRLRSVYPLYLAGLIAAMALDACEKNRGPTLGGPLETVSQLFLLQAWIPTVTESVYQTQCWFLSAILPMWLVHQKVLNTISSWKETSLWVLIVVLSLLPWIGLVIIPLIIGEPMNWYKMHKVYRTDEPVDIWVVMLKFHPVFFFATYLYGMVTAILFVRYRKKMSKVLVYGAAPVAYLALYLIFSESGGSFPSQKLGPRLGALAPLHALLLVGLSIGQDPFSRLLCFECLSWMGELSFPQFVMQFISLSVWDGFGNPGFFIFLLAMSLVANVCVFRPLHNSKAPKERQFLGVLGIAFLPLLCVGIYFAMPHPSGGKLSTEPLPWIKVYSDDMIDRRFNLTLPFVKDVDPNKAYLINPSLLYFEGDLHLAVRYHNLQVSKELGTFNTRDSTNSAAVATSRVTYTWHSYIFQTRLDPYTFEQLEALELFTVAPPFDASAEWQPCLQPPTYIPQNKSIEQIRSIGGLEDPRLFVSFDPVTGIHELGMNFYSNPPRDLAAEAAGTAPGPAYGVYYASVDGEQPLEGLCPKRGRVWNAPTVGDGGNPQARALERQKGLSFVAEKNWMYFEDSAGEQLFVTDMEPFSVTGATSIALDGRLKLMIEKSHARLAATVEKKGAVIHGGANPVLIRDGIFLGSFHTIVNGRYSNYLYEFKADNPYTLLRVSRDLPLLTSPLVDASVSIPMAFSSGLTTLPDGRIVIAYGSSNAESRALILTPAGLEALFDGEGYDSDLPVPVDCEGKWSEWSECHILSDGMCGRERVFSVSELDVRGGVPCSNEHQDVEGQECEEGCSREDSDICVLPVYTDGYDVSGCPDIGSGLTKIECVVKCDANRGFHGRARATCADGGLDEFFLSGCLGGVCPAQYCELPDSIESRFDISGCSASPSTIDDCVVACAAGYGGPEVECFEGEFILGGCEDVDGCEGHACKASGDAGATCSDKPPPATDYRCNCSNGWGDIGGTCEDTPTEVTCQFTVDNFVTYVYYNDEDQRGSTTGDFGDWTQVKTLKFFYVPGSVLAIGGENEESETDRDSTCASGGFLISCSSTDSTCPWNGFKSEVGNPKIRSVGTATDSPPNKWYTATFSGTGFEVPCISLSGFDCYAAESSGAVKIWGSSKYSYFRMDEPNA